MAVRTKEEQLDYWTAAFQKMGTQIIMDRNHGVQIMFPARVQGMAMVKLLRDVSGGLAAYANNLEEEVKAQAAAQAPHAPAEAGASFG